MTHMAPPAKHVPNLMEKLFLYLKTEKKVHPLILSCIFHYELEFIHPFSDGNGRAGRLWQSVLLTHFHPIFGFTPVESVVRERQELYYEALGTSDKEGSASFFIEFSLETIHTALAALIHEAKPSPLSSPDRLDIAREKFGSKDFSRKDYLRIFKTISAATASRDLAAGVRRKILKKAGDKRKTVYHFNTAFDAL